MIKWIFKWVFRLFILAVALVVIFLLSYNPILRLLIEHNIRAQTGMDAEIGRFHLGLTEPTIEIQNLRIYNPPSFGGTPFLTIPEIHVEYDREALAKKEIHITLLRFDLGELDIVKNQAGQTNIFSLGMALPSKKSGGSGAKVLKKETGFDFKQIDVLNVSVGTAKFIDLKDQSNNLSQKIDIENCIMKNVKSKDDLKGLEFYIALKGHDFFASLYNSKSPSLDIFNLIGL